MTQPRKSDRAWRWAFLATLLMMAGYPALAALFQRHGWQASDWNGDGRTTVGEWLDGRHIGRFEFVVDGTPCTEYLELKSGNLVRGDCPARS